MDDSQHCLKQRCQLLFVVKHYEHALKLVGDSYVQACLAEQHAVGGNGRYWMHIWTARMASSFSQKAGTRHESNKQVTVSFEEVKALNLLQKQNMAVVVNS